MFDQVFKALGPTSILYFQIGLSKGMSYVGWKILKDYNGTVVKFSQNESICDQVKIVGLLCWNVVFSLKLISDYSWNNL